MAVPILLDTSALVAAMNTRETHHVAAAEALARLAPEGLLIPATILAETMSFARARFGLAVQRTLWDGLRTSGIEIVATDAQIIAQAREIDQSYSDVGFGFADCTLLATCESLRVARVLSLDSRLAAYRPGFAAALELLP
jgi:predicted nucleic acid-binding protein